MFINNHQSVKIQFFSQLSRSLLTILSNTIVPLAATIAIQSRAIEYVQWIYTKKTIVCRMYYVSNRVTRFNIQILFKPIIVSR